MATTGTTTDTTQTTAATGEHATLEERNKELARVFLDALSRADQDLVADLYADDFRLWTAGSLPFSGTSDRTTALAGMPQILGLFPDGITFTIHAMTAEGDRVAIEATSAGTTFRGDPYRQTYHFLLRARDGKIVEFKEYMDTEHARAVLVGE
jgi:ketosteroid isomerase-like protein